jgi:superfamily I DNA/RNA helicase
LIESHASNEGLVAWTIANEMSQRQGRTAIRTPDAQSRLIRNAISTLSDRQWNRQGGQTFGPYPCAWEASDRQIASALLTEIALPDHASFKDAVAALQPFKTDAAIASVLRRLDHKRRISGSNEFAGNEIAEMVKAAVRDQSRLGLRSGSRQVAMTIQRAKNREFPNVIVLWPHSAVGSADRLRRLLYNAITRASNHCSVVVLGHGRLDGPPFAPSQDE